MLFLAWQSRKITSVLLEVSPSVEFLLFSIFIRIVTKSNAPVGVLIHIRRALLVAGVSAAATVEALPFIGSNKIFVEFAPMVCVISAANIQLFRIVQGGSGKKRKKQGCNVAALFLWSLHVLIKLIHYAVFIDLQLVFRQF